MIFADKTYLHLQLTYDRAYTYSVKFSARLEGTEGYEPGMPVLYLGKFGRENEPGPISADKFDRLYDGLPETWVTDNLLISSNYAQFSPTFMGVYYPPLEDEALEEELRAIYESELLDMPVYPAAGSIVVLDGVAVVKLESNGEDGLR